MTTPSGDRKQRALRQRIVQLRNKLYEISGGDCEFGPAGKGLTPELEVAFLEQILAFETASRTTWGDQLRETGYDPPKPDSLSDEEVGREVWQLIRKLSELRLFIDHTDHLSDRELYEWLYHGALSEETLDVPADADSACHLDAVDAGSHEDNQNWLRYYADEGERREWAREYPDEPIPPHEPLPYQRGHLMPKPSFPPN